MSGAEAVTIVGLISSVICIIETSRRLYDAATNAKGLHEAFRVVANNVSLVLAILQDFKEIQEKAEQEYRTTADPACRLELEKSAEAVRPIMLSCADHARKLQAIFEKVVPGDRATWLERYSKAAQAVMPGKKQTVEDLMKGMLEQLQLLHTSQFFKGVNEDRSESLTAAINTLAATSSSLPDEDGRYSHSGSGPMNVNAGSGRQTNNTISGGSNISQYIADVQHLKK